MRLRPGELRDAMALAFASRRHRPSLLEASPLAEEVAAVLSEEPFGLPLAEIARRLRRRPAAIRATLRGDPRFVSSGSTRGRRWRLAAYRPHIGPRDGMGRNRSEDRDSGAAA